MSRFPSSVVSSATISSSVVSFVFSSSVSNEVVFSSKLLYSVVSILYLNFAVYVSFKNPDFFLNNTLLSKLSSKKLDIVTSSPLWRLYSYS